MAYSRILVPVDGSPTATAGLREAIRLAAAHGAEICLLHVLEKLPALQGMEVLIERQVLENLGQLGRKVLAAARSAVEGHGLRARSVFRRASRESVADAIVAEAKRSHADVIVMGTHGHRGVTHLVLGSDAEAVVRSATVPVLLVSSRAEKNRPRRPDA